MMSPLKRNATRPDVAFSLVLPPLITSGGSKTALSGSESKCHQGWRLLSKKLLKKKQQVEI